MMQNFDYNKDIERFTKEMLKDTQKYQKQYGFNIGVNNNAHNNEADAFRHAYMQSILALRYGTIIAKIVSNNHENQGNTNGQDPKEANMDMWNNHQGQEIYDEICKEYPNFKNLSEEHRKDIIARKVVQRMKSGKLITTPNDKRKYTGFATDIPDGKIFTAEEIGKLSTDEFSKYENYIDNQLETYGVPRNYQAQQDVVNGVLIWVDRYKRDDGTEVSGYYRKK